MAGADTLRDEAAIVPLSARSDADDRLIAADPPLAAMQRACGGDIPGLIAAPDLLELVRKARGFGMRLARPLALRGGTARLDGWVEIEPDADGCAIRLSEWHASDGSEPAGEGESTRLAIENLLAEAVIWLGDRQQVLAIESEAADLARLVQRTRAMRGEPWMRLFDLPGADDAAGEPVWRARRGFTTRVEGSQREWHLLLAPASGGYRILMRPASEPLPRDDADDLLPANLLRDQLAPAMHDPVRRIIRQAEAIRDRLAGPLPAEYREYAVDIVRAGQHLRELADELGDAEAIEHGTIEIAAETFAVADVIDDACRLLQVRADARGVTLLGRSGTEEEADSAVAYADRRRSLQILLNIVGNAIDYGPQGGKVVLSATQADGRIAIAIDDDGEGLSDEDRIRMFDKFERLGRSGDSGSGLGLYIALMLARAMGGGIEAAQGQQGGNRFTVTLPSA